MELEQATLARMQDLVAAWRASDDRRGVFLECYAMMTANMLEALRATRFEDGPWVAWLLERFAGYYFDVLAAHERDDIRTPAAWRLAHEAAARPHTMVLQNLVQGVDAHINYDLVLTLVDVLDDDWMGLSPAARDARHHDFCYVNRVIAETVDRVQDEVVERRAPLLSLLDWLGGPVDELLVVRLIASWLDTVWRHAVATLEEPTPAGRELLRSEVEAGCVRWGRRIFGRRDDPDRPREGALP